MMKQTLLCILIFTFSIIIVKAQVSFPLQLSQNNRYLQDAKGEPFLIKEFSAWGLIQALSEEDEGAFLDSIREKGFNTVLVSIVSNASSQMGGDPPFWQGISPFHLQWDFSTPNETYFSHVDRFLQVAESKGFFVMLLPCYLGYFTDGGQGWWDEVRGENNSRRKMKIYGEFLGKRYRNTPNIMWVVGGDNDAKGVDEPYIRQMVEGIKSFDSRHLWSGHFDNTSGTFWSTGNERFHDLIDLDGQYVWKEISLGNKGPQYVSELRQYRNGKMIFQLDQSYEHDVPHYADNENPLWIRRKMYDGLLSGCAGTSFSSGTLDNQCYWFKDWKPLMSTDGMKKVSFCFKLFDRLPWQTFVPDTTSAIITEGRGTFGDRDYICAAKSVDDRFYILYMPKGHTIFVNMKAMSFHTMRLHWYNPRTGRSIRIGHVGGDKNFGIVAPDEKDWILVFDALESFQMP